MSADEAVAYPTQTVVACEACGVTVDVIWYCKNCPGSLCSSCKDVHRTTSITSKHSVVPRTGKVVRTHGPAKIAEQCRIHREKEISVYCNKCKVACCISCFAEKHQLHEFAPIEEKYLTAEKGLNDYTKQLEKDVMPKLDEMEAKIRSGIKDGDQQREKVKEEVNAFREEMKQTVDEACDTLIDTLYLPTTELNDKLQEIEKQRKKVTDLIQSCSDRVREGKLSIIEYTPPTPASLMPTVTPPKASTPVFVPGREVLDIIREKIGTLSYKYSKQQASDPSSEKLSPAKVSKPFLKIKTFNTLKTKIGASSIASAGNNTAWVMDLLSDTMYLYSDSGEVIRSVTVMKNIGINDMVLAPCGDMIVSIRDMKVRCVDTRSKVSTLIDTAPFSAIGVCLTDRGEIVVCMSDQGERNHVAVYSSDGRKKLREIRCQNAQGKQLFTDPCSVVQNGEDMCVVNGGYVVCVDERGDVRWLYDGTQAKLKESFNPHGICRDKYHNLLVTDYGNHCVHYIDREGQLIQVILTQEQTGLQRHWGISVDDETGHVWVGNMSRDVVVASYTAI